MFKDLGVFSERQLSRMNDAALITDIIYSLENGNKSASEPNLDKLYRIFEEDFDSQKFKALLEYAFGFILERAELHKGPLMKPYNFFSMVLSLIHVHKGPISALQSDYQVEANQHIDSNCELTNLSILAEALEASQIDQKFVNFVGACSKATNRIAQRKERFKWFCKALVSVSLS
jgi:hypothetical protein